jgi:hypothetical protein
LIDRAACGLVPAGLSVLQSEPRRRCLLHGTTTRGQLPIRRHTDIGAPFLLVKSSLFEDLAGHHLAFSTLSDFQVWLCAGSLVGQEHHHGATPMCAHSRSSFRAAAVAAAAGSAAVALDLASAPRGLPATTAAPRTTAYAGHWKLGPGSILGET